MYNFSAKIEKNFDPAQFTDWLSSNFDGSFTANTEKALWNALSSASGGDEVVSVSNPVVTDQLSSAVEMVNVEQTATENEQAYSVPQFWVTGKATGKDGSTNAKLNANQCKLRSVTENDDKTLATATYSFGGVNNAVVYDFSTKTITWNVADTLPSGSTKTLIYSVTAVTPTSNTQLETADADTGTHSSQQGYKSNKEAKLTYDNGGEKTFPHPVVVPSTTVTITKNVVGTYVSSDRKYSFTATFSNIPTVKNNAAVVAGEKTAKAVLRQLMLQIAEYRASNWKTVKASPTQCRLEQPWS